MFWKIRLRQGWSLGILCLAILTCARPALAAGEHYVFAHYMVCYATYGETVEGYKREIMEAKTAGIDGFILDIGVWNHPVWTYYNKRVPLIFQAAEELGVDFKLSFFIEFPEPANIIDLIETYGNRTNTLKQNGQIVLSAWGMNDVPTLGWVGVDWKNDVLDPLKKAGYPIFFIPHFWPAYANELPGYEDAEDLLIQNADILQGLFLFGAAGTPSELAVCNSNYTAALHAAGKVSMASYTPSYWGCWQENGRRYFESDGGEGTIRQWQSIIQSQPDWVDLVTWNDFGESTYCTPVQNPEQYDPQLGFVHRNSHAGYLELTKHYITWFKTGKEPAVDRDCLFYFYRTQTKDSPAGDTNDTPVYSLIGDVQDTIYTTVFLTAPATLETVSGTQQRTNSLNAGLNCVRTPFAAGSQSFTVRRNGLQVLNVKGPAIQSRFADYNYFPASGYGYRPTLRSPDNLTISGN